ncbi:MAG: alkaline phosphatase family protein [Gemmatimonadota bacterium]
MVRTSRPALAACLLLSALTACGSGEPEAPIARMPKVLVIGIDGVRPDVLAEVATPNLDALAAEGTFTATARTGFPSVSGPGWSSLLTGVWSDKHGVTDNEFVGKNYGAYPDFLTRIEQVRPELSTFAVADWLPLVYADDGQPTLSDAIDVKHVLDGYKVGWPQGDSESVRLTIEALQSGDPDALFVYLGTPDEVSHETGAIGDEYRDAIVLADSQVGALVRAVRDRRTYPSEDWLVLVSTDHGRLVTGGHGGDTPEERTIFYLASGSSTVKGSPVGQVEIVDVAVTALAHLGIETDPAWQLDGHVVGLAAH